MTVLAAYLAADGFEAVLAEELDFRGVVVSEWHGRLALSPQPPIDAAWALDTWTAPQEIPIASVKDASDALRAIQRNWSGYQVANFRRATLIADRLPPVKARALVFPEPAPTAHLGAWTLLAPDRMLVSASKTSPFVNGECRFEEDHIGPPSRAYLKLWEACTRLGWYPKPGETCLDLGASPGGWTWALAELGATVIAIDKAPLDPNIAARPNVTTRQESAFALEPEKVDWLFSDIIAYPDRLLALIQRWIAADAPGHIVCTLKFQGQTDHATAQALAEIPGSRLLHLSHNRHELTYAWARPVADSVG